jgi:hypothetical protein
LIFFILVIESQAVKSQNIANYVTNGSFEEHYPCNGLNMINLCKGWRSIDSSLYAGVFYFHTCFGNVPNSPGSIQYPKTSEGFGGATFFCMQPECVSWGTRGFFRNRLKKNLVSSQKYCVKFYINLRDISSIAIDRVGVYFCDNIIDTITKINIPLPFIIPQVQNTLGNLINDTINWIPLTGTFVATGNETNLLLGNFYTDANTNTLTVKTYTPLNRFCDFNIDDVSCIPLDLPAYAGPDKSCKIGDSVYVGRERDFAIDPGCTWFQLPNMSVPIATASGIWVKPTVTTTYVVKQVLDCSALKYDTVVVYADLVGLPGVSSSGVENGIRFFPNPATNKITFEYKDELQLQTINIKNILGQQVLQFIEPKKEIDVSFLSSGIYYLTVETNKGTKTFKLQKE